MSILAHIPPMPVDDHVRRCKFCSLPIRQMRWMGYRFWCDPDQRGDTCHANPTQLRPFGGEHEPR